MGSNHSFTIKLRMSMLCNWMTPPMYLPVESGKPHAVTEAQGPGQYRLRNNMSAGSIDSALSAYALLVIIDLWMQ